MLSIPRAERIPELAAKDFDGVSMAITVALTLALEGMNLKRGMNAIQIVDLAELIIDSSAEDDLAFEDLMLFLQKLVRGQYGTNYESMDLPKFMEKFEVYREQRHQELYRIKYERHDALKSLGPDKTSRKDELGEHFANLGSEISKMKGAVKNLKEQNKNLQMDNL